MKIETIATYRNETDGLEALIMDGNDKHNYRVVFRDTDADETVFVRFKHTHLDCMKDVKEFLMQDFIHVESVAASTRRKDMEKSIDWAAQEFVSRHKTKFLDLDHIKDGYGSVAGFLSAEGQPTGDRGGKQIEIKSWHHKDGWTDTVEWFEDTFQIGYYRLPREERVTPQDHTPELNFDPDFNWCLDRIKELRHEGYYDISMHEVSEGEYVSEIRIEDYIEDWETA